MGLATRIHYIDTDIISEYIARKENFTVLTKSYRGIHLSTGQGSIATYVSIIVLHF